MMESHQRQKSRELAPKQIQIIEQNQRYSGINKMSKEIFKKKWKHNETIGHHGNKEKANLKRNKRSRNENYSH